MQKAGIDYTDTFAPVVKWGSLRNIVLLVAQKCWNILHMDVKSAFLNGTLYDEVYITQPLGFVIPGQESRVCKVLKSLYRIHQSP
jgi:hypothetical protein